MKRITFVAEIQTSDKNFNKIRDEYIALTQAKYEQPDDFIAAYFEFMDATTKSFYVDIIQLNAIDSTPKPEEKQPEEKNEEAK